MVCKDEEPLPSVRSADLSRAVESFRNAETQRFQIPSNLTVSEIEVVGDVLEEAPLGLALPEDAGDVRPDVARVVGAGPPSGDGEGLAGVSAHDAIHRATPSSAVEGGQVRPDRR
jgi:hypothetical protein